MGMILAVTFIQLVGMNFLKNSFLLFIILSLHVLQCKKENKNVESLEAVEIKDSAIVSNLRLPWEILWGPDDHIWMTERNGKISRVNPSTGAVTTILTIDEVVSMGEGGLLGLVLHPNFVITPYVFVVYNYDSGSGYTEKVIRYTYNGSTLIDPKIIIDNIEAANFHNGSRLLIIGDKLFISTGDASNQSLAQNKSSLNGKILRLNLNGSVPADNPVAGNPYWSFGHRNPQGLVFANNKLYSSEHGPSDNDEINIIEKDRNYGWPNVHGPCNTQNEQDFCSANNVAEPIQAWTPTIATCGLDYYNNDLIPQWKNSLLLVALKNSRLYQMKLDDTFSKITNTNEYFTGKYGRMRDLCISPQGKVYICTSNGSNDKIIEVTKK